MCGIVGILRKENLHISSDEINLMMQIISYRGPDDKGVYTNECIGLGHVRLSIQDLSDLAKQPMASHDRRYVIVYNGEIYNVAEIRKELMLQGVNLKSTGDTEALLEYLALFGIEASLAKMDGMFAFALWDNVDKKLYLARDRHGIKPLYYTQQYAGEIRFASEMKSLLSSCPEPDMATINSTLLGLGATWGERTVFRDIKHVCAGELLTIDASQYITHIMYSSIEAYADEEYYLRMQNMSKKQIVEYANNIMEENMTRQLISDAPIGVFVSGGLDSSLIASLANKYYRNLSLYHADVEYASERSAAEALAGHLGLPLKSVHVNDVDIVNKLAITTYHYENPLGYHYGSDVPFYMVSELASKEHIKVILTGEGSDEYFIGYPSYILRPYVKYYQYFVQGIKYLYYIFPKLGAVLWPDNEKSSLEQMKHLLFNYELHERRELSDKTFSFIKNDTERYWYSLCIDMVMGNVRTLLQRNDRLGMAWGLESRFPFLTNDVAHFAANLPYKYKIHKTLKMRDWRHLFISDKWIVRAVAEKYIPIKLAYRPKYGFRSTFYERININPEVFSNGFLFYYYCMTKKSIEYLFATTTRRWIGHLLNLEIWGRVFIFKENLEVINKHINRHVH
jgi:asparagine synthase (glutamine-hydrolysing)